MQVKDGELLGRMITVKKYSQRAFATQLGWRSHTYLQRLIRGDVRSVTPDAAALISHLLEVPQDVLFETKVSTNRVQTVDASRPRRAS